MDFLNNPIVCPLTSNNQAPTSTFSFSFEDIQSYTFKNNIRWQRQESGSRDSAPRPSIHYSSAEQETGMGPRGECRD